MARADIWIFSSKVPIQKRRGRKVWRNHLEQSLEKNHLPGLISGGAVLVHRFRVGLLLSDLTFSGLRD